MVNLKVVFPKVNRVVLTAAFAGLALAACDPEEEIAGASRTSKAYLSANGTSANVTSDRYIVVLKKGVAQRAVAGRAVPDIATSMQQQYGGKVFRTYQYALEGALMELPATAAAALKADSRVAYVEPDQLGSVVATQPNATWGLDRVDQRPLPLNQTYTYPNQAGAGVHAYIIDSGVYAAHPEFALSGGGSRVIPGVDFQDNDANPDDCNGHGTHVAGTVGSATYGVAKQVTLHSIRVVDCGGFGMASTALAAVDYVTNNHLSPAVANMSLRYPYTQALNDAVTNSIASGVTYAIAAANDAQDACLTSPGSVPNAITVGGTDISDVMYTSSDFGPCVDIFAPAVNVTSTWIAPALTNTITGTSMATPHVAGASALYLGANPTATPAAVAAALVAQATPNLIQNLGPGSPNLLLYMGFLNQAATPCENLCNNPVNFSINGSYQSGALGTGAICRQTTSPVHGGNCGNFVSPRTLRVNGELKTCNNLNWSSVPAPRNGGYCVQTTTGNHPWAFFTLW